MTGSTPSFRDVLSAATAWARTSGWPTQAQDLEITLEVVRRLAGIDCNLTAEILEALQEGNNQEALVHRVVLCRLEVRLTDLSVDAERVS